MNKIDLNLLEKVVELRGTPLEHTIYVKWARSRETFN